MKAINQMTSAEARGIRYILMDIDDTLTREGKLFASAYEALWKLKDAGLAVIPVTGRPAGWCDLIAREWPADGVVGENGALAFWEETRGGKLPVLKQDFFPGAIRNDHPVLEKIKERVWREIPGIRLAKDQFARMFDIALDFAEEEPVLSLEDAERAKRIAEEEGAVAKVSSIHVNVWMGNYDKLSMAKRFLNMRFAWNEETDLHQVVFCGDSPNDEPMFRYFPLACGVANVKRYAHMMRQLPAFVASRECGDGFAEIASLILERRR